MFGVTISITFAVAYLVVLNRKEKRRGYVVSGYLCPRCRKAFEFEDLKPLWRLYTIPLRFMGWNKRVSKNIYQSFEVRELDAGYCSRCRCVIHSALVASLIITLPVVFSGFYLVLMHLGAVD